MKCFGKCGLNKLSNEFIKDKLSKTCNHPNYLCLRCAEAASKDTKKCPYPGCEGEILDEEIKECQATINSVFSEVAAESHTSEKSINIILLNNSSLQIDFDPEMTIKELKEKIADESKIKSENQTLHYQSRTLGNICEDGKREAILKDYEVQAGAKIYLLVRLYEVAKDEDKLIFELSWEYPSSGKDFLDATCFVFQKDIHKKTVDFHENFYAPGAAIKPVGIALLREKYPVMIVADVDDKKKCIQHSGDIEGNRDDERKIASHTINIDVKKLPKDDTHMFFTLSAHTSPDISCFPNPTLRLYRETEPGKDLCNTLFPQKKKSKAIIMCYMQRQKSGWHIYRCGILSEGNKDNYDLLMEKIKQLIVQFG